MSTDYGTDWFNTNDLDPRMPTLRGRIVPIQRFVRRLYTPRGSCPDAPNDGIDVRDFLNSTLTVEQIQGLIQGELSKDPACLIATATVTFSGPLNKKTAKIEIDGELSDGPFALVIGVSSLTVELLSFS
jgi:hypothetical protein